MFYRKTIPLWLIIWVGLVMPYGVLAAGNVTGTVMDIGNNPLPNISAIASQWNCNGWYQKSTATTDVTGHYNLNLAEGVYRVTFHDNTGTYAEHKTTKMTVTDGSTMSGINAQLVLGGDIAGTVTNASSTPVENIKVTVHVLNDNSWYWLDSTSTDNVGYYKFTALKPGTYHLRFSDNNWPKFYQEEYYNDAATLDAGTDVQVTAGNTTSISNVINEGAHIIGTVIDENNQPLESVNVEAYFWNGDYWDWQASFHTDSNGQYDLTGLSNGEYALKFSSSTHITEYYTDAFDRDNATKIAVLAGKTTTNINAQLAPGGFISGTVTDINANLLQNIRVEVYDINGDWQKSTYTDSDGNYTLGGLNTSSYKLLFEQPDWDNVVYAPKTVTEIQVTVGQTTSGINVQLGAAGHITGIVTDKDNKPLSEVQVTAFQQQGNVWSHIQDTRTDDMGYYVLTGLGTGNYQVEFSCYNSDLPSEYYNDTLNISDATDISVTAGNATTDINAQLAVVGGSIISTVPAIPSNLNTTIVSQTEMTLNWTDNSDNETGFKIFRNGTELTPSPKVVANVTSFNDTGLTCATAYTYEVKATNANGDSAAISANATTQACPLPVVFHSLTIQTPGTGKGSIEGTEAGSHAEGTLVTLTAVAETGSEFKAWTPAICEKTFILTSDFTCTAEFTLKPQVPEVDLVTSDFCKLNPDYSECQVVNACKENPNDCITGFKLIDSTIPTVAIANSLDLSQPSISPVIDIVGLKASFAAHGDNLSDGTNITVEDCENMQLLPGGDNAKREFFCSQWGLPGIKKGVVKDQNGAELYDFEVDARYDCKAVTEIPVAECETLSKLYNETNGKDWKNAATNKWLIDITPCGWDGITCANGHVTQLLLADNNLSGSLPDLCPLTELEELDLSNNAIEGEIPSCLSKLKFANLFGTQVQSVIANICKWNPTLSWCKETSPLQSVVTACQQTANSPICSTKIKFIPSVGAVIATEPNQPVVTDYVGLPVSFTAIGSELNIDTEMTVEDCSDVLLLPNGTITKREFYCMQWGLPGLKKGAFKKADGHLLYEFDVDTKYICEAVTEIPIEECQTLLTLYNSTQGQEWKNASTNKWLRDIKPCGWSGITCGNGRITKIDLEENQLSGSIPDLSALTDLKRLDLRNNQLSGSIPDLSALTNLEWLWLSYNQLSGSIPNLSMLTNLELLGLSYNQLSGSIPDLSHASNTLTALYLTNNQLCGEITPSLASLVHISDPDSSTKFFSISDNHLWTNDSTLIAFLNKKEPSWANTQTPAEGCGVQPTTPSTPTVSYGGGTPSMPSIPADGSINGSYNNGGATVTEDFTVEPGSSISNLVIEGKVTNHGTMSNVTIEECAELIGGKLSGYITNHGLVHDFEFVGATLTGGMLSGHIYNKSKVGGRFIDVTLLADTVIEGGILEGKIQGDCEAPALLKNLTVKKGSHLSCVTIDDSVILKDDVIQEPVWDEYETGEVLELGCGKTITIPKETGDSVVLEDDVIITDEQKNAVEIEGISPLVTTIGNSTVFTIKGKNIPNGIGFTVGDCVYSNVKLEGGTSTQRQFICTQYGEPGIKRGLVKDKPGGKILSQFDVTAQLLVQPLVYVTTNAYLFNEDNNIIEVYLTSDMQGQEVSEELYDAYLVVVLPNGGLLFDVYDEENLREEPVPYVSNFEHKDIGDWLTAITYSFTENSPVGEYSVHLILVNSGENFPKDENEADKIVAEDSVTFFYDPDSTSVFIGNDHDQNTRTGYQNTYPITEENAVLARRGSLRDITQNTGLFIAKLTKNGFGVFNKDKDIEKNKGFLQDPIDYYFALESDVILGKLDDRQRDILFVTKVINEVFNSQSLWQAKHLADGVKKAFNAFNQRARALAEFGDFEITLNFKHQGIFTLFEKTHYLNVTVQPLILYDIYGNVSAKYVPANPTMKEAAIYRYDENDENHTDLFDDIANFEVSSTGQKRIPVPMIGLYLITATDKKTHKEYKKMLLLDKVDATHKVSIDY